MRYNSEAHEHLSTQTWDAIIIGSGLGGMTTACLLAKAGRKVLLLERHTVPGGFTHTFKRKGFEWDVGVHYVGQVSKSVSIIRKVFDYVTDKTLTWADMDPVFDRIEIAGDKYDYVAGIEAQTENLIRHFPNDADAIRAYIKLVRATSRSGAWFFGEKTMPFWMSHLVGRFLRRTFETWAAKTTFEVLHSLTSNEKLISVLCAQCGDYGLEPQRSSFGIHAVVVEHYMDGASYPVGGAGQIHKSILSVFEKNGGTLVLNADVRRILIEGGRAVGVEFHDRKTLHSKVIVSNAGFGNTFRKLIPALGPALDRDLKTALLFDPVAQAESVAPSTAHVCLYVGLDSSDAALGIPKNNFWIYETYNFSESMARFRLDPESPFPLVYISFPSAKDPLRDQQNGGRATIQVIAPYDFDTVKEWKDRAWGRRGDEYDHLKEELKQKLTNALIKAVPQIEGHIAYSELSSPLSTRHFMNYESGEIYGLEHTPARFALRSLRPQTRIKGLFLTGQDVVTVGVAGALYSGVLTATTILKKSVILRILFNLRLSRRST